MSKMTQNIFQIEKLDENNYGIWSIQMKSILVHSELWNIVCENERRPTVNFQHYDTMDEKAKNDKVVEHLNKFCETYDQLEEAGITLPDEVKAIILLSSLPKSFENFVIIIETRDNLPKFENIKIKLLEESERRKQTADQNIEDTQQAYGAKATTINETQRRKYVEKKRPSENPDKPKGKCFSCGKIGHFARNCRKSKTFVNNSLSVVATLDETSLNKNKWYLDSGATSHMSNNSDWFINLEKCWQKIELAGNQYVRAVGKEMGFNVDSPMVLNGDNQSAQHLVRNPKFHPRSKHIDIKRTF